MTLTPAIISAFEANYLKGSSEQCWPWIGSTTYQGYGQLKVADVFYRAHRLAYAIRRGVFSPEWDVLHTCDNPPCVNPSHLFLGDDALNRQDCVDKGRQAKKLSAQQVLEIRFKASLGIALKELAREHLVSVSHISHIVNRVRRCQD